MHHPFAILKDRAIKAQPDHFKRLTPGTTAPRRCGGDAGWFGVRLLGNLTTDRIEFIPSLRLGRRDAGTLKDIFAIEEGEGAAGDKPKTP